jgi:threonine dehydratase
MADGLRVSTPGELTRQVCARVLDDVVLVTEEDVKRTIIDLARRDRVLAEGAGAVAVAALDQVPGDRRVAIVSGGNIDMERFAGLFPPALPLKNRLRTKCLGVHFP